MQSKLYHLAICCVVATSVFGCGATTAKPAASAKPAALHNCGHAGPQAPRDIDQLLGTNSTVFSTAPHRTKLNLCNIHFHANAEHRGKAFAIPAKTTRSDLGGYQCSIGQRLTSAELRPPQKSICKGIKPGDTIEMHWVHTSCDITPGPGLGSCVSDVCANPNLRVEAQMFVLVNDPTATSFADLDYAGGKINGYHQAKKIPSDTGSPVEFLGSSTGTKYNNNTCSPYQITWSVRPYCAKLDINSLHAWCESNQFNEDHAHESRLLVTDPAMLSNMQ